jgi:hypothetical protein
LLFQPGGHPSAVTSVRTLLTLLAAAVLALPLASAAAPLAPADRCTGEACDAVNYLCPILFHRDTCVLANVPAARTEAALPALRCVGLPCDLINLVCYTAFHVWCVA